MTEQRYDDDDFSSLKAYKTARKGRIANFLFNDYTCDQLRLKLLREGNSAILAQLVIRLRENKSHQ